jgi:molecular chaperone GrpE
MTHHNEKKENNKPMNEEANNQINPEEVTSSEDFAVRESPESLENQIKELTDEKNQLFNKLQRTMADYQNYQKKSAKDRQEAVQRAELSAIERFLFPAVDDLDRALKAAVEHGLKQDDPFYKGVEMVREHLFGMLKQIGIEPIDAEGKIFDPMYHESLMQQPTGDVPEKTILQIISRGYTQNGRTIRPVRVVVSALPKVEPTENSVSNDHHPKKKSE